MVGSIEIGMVGNAATMVANRGWSVEVMIESELTGVAAVRIGEEKVPILRVVSGVNDAIIGSESQATVSVEGTGDDLRAWSGVLAGPIQTLLEMFNCTEAMVRPSEETETDKYLLRSLEMRRTAPLG